MKALLRRNRELSPVGRAQKGTGRDESPVRTGSVLCTSSRNDRESSPLARALARKERTGSPVSRAMIKKDRESRPTARKDREQSPMTRQSMIRDGDSPNKYIVPSIVSKNSLNQPTESFNDDNTAETGEDVKDSETEKHQADTAPEVVAPEVDVHRTTPTAKSSYAEIVMSEPEPLTVQEKLRRYKLAKLCDEELGLPLSQEERLRYQLSLIGEDDMLMPSSLTLKERLRYRMSLLEDDLEDEAWERIAGHVVRNNDPNIPLSGVTGNTRYFRVPASDALVPRGLFHHAARGGELAMVQTLVMDGADVNETDVEGMTALHHAVIQSQYAVVKFLLSLRSTIVNLSDLRGKSPLHYSVEKGHTPILMSLLSHGAFPNNTDVRKQTPLHKACQDGRHNMVDILLENGASVFAFDDLMKAPLHYAVENNHPACVTALIRKGAPVNNSDGDQRTPLHYAAELGFFLIADILLANGAIADALEKDMKTALFIAVQNDFTSMTRTLISYNASVNTAEIERLTPLHIASVNGNTELVLVLLQHGADMDAVDCANRTPISYAVDNNEIEAVQVLLQHDASVTVMDVQDMTPVHYAAEVGDEFLVHLLADHELNNSTNDSTYNRLLDVAFKYQNELLGSMTMTHAIKGYNEIISQDNQTEKSKGEATDMMKSLLDMVCIHFSHYHGEKLVHVWPGYNELAPDAPMIVVNVSTIPKIKPKAFMGLPIVYKVYGLVSDETIVLSCSKLEIARLTDPLEIMAIQRIINRNIARLKLDHSNLVKVSASAVRSLQNGSLLAKEPCIVLYCRSKGIIPFGENPFPKSVDGIPVDVRDGLAGDLDVLDSRINVSKLAKELRGGSRSCEDIGRRKLEF